MKIVWRKKAFEELEENYEYIKSRSPQNAISIMNNILVAVESLPNFLYKFPVDPIINLEHVGYTVVFSFKIVYAIHKDSIVVLRILIHTNPKKLKF